MPRNPAWSISEQAKAQSDNYHAKVRSIISTFTKAMKFSRGVICQAEYIAIRNAKLRWIKLALETI